MKLRLDIQHACAGATPPASANLRRWVRAALGDHPGPVELSLRIVDEGEITELNARYRGKNYPTNVLSFPADLPPELNLPQIGDIVICAPVVAREAAEQGKTEEAHWAHLVIHGTLHLLGYDHIEEDEAEAMEALEIQLLHQLDFPNPYEPAERIAPAI